MPLLLPCPGSDHVPVGAEDLAVDPGAVGPARKDTAAPTSWGVPRRPSGFIFAVPSMSSCDLPCRDRSVAVVPGAMASTVIDRPRNSFERGGASVWTADLVAA